MKKGHSFSENHTKPKDFYCYGKEILAPADGEVVEVKDKYPDSVILDKGQADCAAKDIPGQLYSHSPFGKGIWVACPLETRKYPRKTGRYR